MLATEYVAPALLPLNTAHAGTQPYSNPHLSGAVKASISLPECADPSRFVQHEVDQLQPMNFTTESVDRHMRPNSAMVICDSLLV